MQRNIFEGSDFLLFDIDNNPIAYCKNSAIKINRALADVTTKDSDGWLDFLNGIKSWSLDFEGLVSYDDTSFSTSYFLSKFKNSEPFFIQFGILQDGFTHTFWGEVTTESIEIDSDNGEVVTYSGTLKGIGKLTFTNQGTPEQSGYIKAETDPYFRSSPAHSITNTNISNWNNAFDKTLNEVLFNTTGNTTTLNVKLRDGSLYSTSFNHLGGGGGTVLTGLTFNPSNGNLSVNNLTTNLDGRYQPLGAYVSQQYLTDNHYSKTQSDSRFATFTYVSNEISNLVNSAPSTLDTLQELANALGNDENFSTTITALIGTKANTSDVYSKLDANSIFQPLENQRLSTSNNVVFNQITANSKLNIPSTSSNKYSLYVDENGIGGTGSTINIISYLNDLSDVTISSNPSIGNVLMFDGSQWINSTVTSGTFDYNALYNKPTHLSQFTNDLGNYGSWVTKAQTDTYYYPINNPNGFITSASLPDLSPYAYANGSNASGTWNISINGNAEYLNGYQSYTTPNANSIVRRDSSGYVEAVYFRNANSYVASSAPTYITGEFDDGYYYKFNSTAIQAFVGLNNGTTLNNNISGYADNAAKWNGLEYSNAVPQDGNINSMLAVEEVNGVAYRMTKTAVSNWLGSVTSLPNSIVRRDSSGYLVQNYIEYTGGAGNGVITGIMAKTDVGGNYIYTQNATSVKSFLNISDGSTLYNNISGNAATSSLSNMANYLKAANIYPNVITNATSAASLVDGSLTRVDFAELTNSWIGSGSYYSSILTYSGYDRYGAMQLSNYYNATSPRLAIRNFNQSLNDWNSWVEVLTTGNGTLQKITDLGNTTSNSIGADTFYAPNWFRSYAATGWYNEDFGGGIYMVDTAWVRVYGGKAFLVENQVRATKYVSTVDGFEADNFGIGLVGLYSATRYQSVFSMGANYKPATDGTSLANHYGIAWTHDYVGGQAKGGLGHQMLITEAGVTQTAIGNGIWTRANIYAAGTMEAPTIKATNNLQIPAKNTSGVNTSNHFSIWVEI